MWEVLLSLLLVVLAALVYLVYPTWKLRRIPALPSLWGIGHMQHLMKHKEQLFVKLAEKFGPVFRIQMGRQPIVFVASVELCRELGMRKFKSAYERGTPVFVRTSHMLLQSLAFTRDMKTWSSMRNVIQAVFHPEQLSNYTPIMKRAISLVADILYARSGEDVNITKLLHTMALDVVGESVFGTKFSLLESETTTATTKSDNGQFVDAITKSVQALTMDQKTAPFSTTLGFFFPILQLPAREILKRIPGTRDWQQHMNSIKLMEKATKLLEIKKKQSNGNMPTKDVITMLLQARDQSMQMQELMTDDRILSLAYELFLSGSDTTANTLSAVLYHVSEHPRVEEKLLKEIREFAPTGKELSPQDMEKLTYLDQVIKESMRVLYLAPIVGRMACEDIEIGGYNLPKGTWIWMALIAPARDPNNFPEPHEFRPERFDADCEENKVRDPFAHSPFGLGPRMCPGYRYAKLELKIAIVHLLQRFTFEHSPLMEKPLALQLGITASPQHGIKLRAHPRT